MMQRLAGVAVAIVVVLATAISANGRDDALSRPLHLPSPAAGARCPVSHGTLASKLGHGLARMPVAGDGPAYVMSVGGEPAGSVSIDGARVDPQGWRGQKAPWIADPRYRGPLLIRGARIDAQGPVRFARDTGEHLKAIYQRRGQGVQPNGWRVWGGTLLVRKPGCYGLQVDGLSFSNVIVIRVRA
jgi:hypothetical protein